MSFSDCDLDSKGAAFEYFVRATLKGEKLGQYFTPRPLVKLMLSLGASDQIINSVTAGEEFKVLDPACGTGGFLVLAMNVCLAVRGGSAFSELRWYPPVEAAKGSLSWVFRAKQPESVRTGP